ncbi:hypothetical protein IV203_032486 [Nitzschia inconspicua]|uniref:Uncharacterized protein n=1 Tax=Nitzschia inconspicua TaxID=303405 RepID=A0A9K3KKV2_9STRA|nr:hypothetical protein IV203_032486 [Nitzschia inconspicua]
MHNLLTISNQPDLQFGSASASAHHTANPSKHSPKAIVHEDYDIDIHASNDDSDSTVDDMPDLLSRADVDESDSDDDEEEKEEDNNNLPYRFKQLPTILLPGINKSRK